MGDSFMLVEEDCKFGLQPLTFRKLMRSIIMKKFHLTFLLWCALLLTARAQKYFSISGYLTDETNGETIIGANVYNQDNPVQGTATNDYGFYSLSLPPDHYRLVFSFLGYQDKVITIYLGQDTVINLALSEGLQIEEVVVVAKRPDENIAGTSMGKVDLPMENIKTLPAIFGEVDVLKTLQLLPGVRSAGEGGTGFYVRGGGADQNLVLLDEAPVYNSGHMLGFFSIFNADAIKNTTLYKGEMPARYGGRLSSVVDVQMKEGNARDLEIDGGIGLISSRLTLQGPIVKERTSFIVSARRTYIMDLVQPFIKNSNFSGTNYYFYDLNAKVNTRFSQRDRLYFSTYFGRDVLNYKSEANDFAINMPYGNATATLRWNHLFNDKLFVNTSVIFNDYQFSFAGGQDVFNFKLSSGVNDWNGKIDFDYYPNYRHKIRFGGNIIYHTFTPNVVEGAIGDVEFKSNIKPKYGLETALYLQDEWSLSSKITVNAGLRYSRFSQLGPYQIIDGDYIPKGQSVISYDGVEPRFGLGWKLNSSTSIKAGYTYANQYVHLVSNSSSTLPTDVWVPSSVLVKPQQGAQYAAGVFKNWINNALETSVEVYFRNMHDQIDYRDDYVNNVGTEVETNFVFGTGRAYGAEFFLRKTQGDLNGWLGYTLSRTERSFPLIEQGRWYPATYDRIHDLSLVGNYALTKKWDLGLVFIYGTGRAYTPVEGVYFIDQKLVTNYAPRNSLRLEPYHRLDLSATYRPKADRARSWQGYWTFSIYNMYNRRNTFFTYVNYKTDLSKGSAQAQAYKVSIFPIIPSITWNFKWK